MNQNMIKIPFEIVDENNWISTCVAFFSFSLLLLFSWPLLYLQLQRQIQRQTHNSSIDQDLEIMDMEATPHCPCLASDMPITQSEMWFTNPLVILTLHLVST